MESVALTGALGPDSGIPTSYHATYSAVRFFEANTVDTIILICYGLTSCGSRKPTLIDFLERFRRVGEYRCMIRLLRFLSTLFTVTLRTRLSLQLEVATLRHQLSVY
jgi:hypothetical protein